MSVDYRIIQIGAMDHNLLWGEQRPIRPTVATCTLVVQDDRWLLVDPSLPAESLAATFAARTGRGLEVVTDVFCTTLTPEARRGLPALAHANCWAGETELEWYGQKLEALAETTDRLDAEQARDVEKEIEQIRRFRPPPEKFSEQITVYPLAGPTPGCTGVLLTPPMQTVVIAGPAAPTREHVERGMVWQHAADTEQAMESLTDMLELADLIVPGFDNVMFCPQRMI